MKDRKSMKNGTVDFSPLSHLIIGCAIEVHRVLGPGLLESTYRRCLAHELRLRGAQVDLEVPVAIEYKGLKIECAYKIDLFVNRQAIVEVKSLRVMGWGDQAQTLTHMKLAPAELGFLINFSARRLVDGLHSFVL